MKLCRRIGLVIGSLAVLLALPGKIPAGDALSVHTLDERRAPVLDTFVLPEATQALALSPDGRGAAIAVSRDVRKGPRTRLELHSLDARASTSVELDGVVRDLLFSPDGSIVYVLHHEIAKKRAGDVHLVRIELSDPKPRKEMLLPPSARGLGFWSAESSLLVACQEEIRTIVLPGLRSGPLYRIPGGNRSVASIAGSLVLVGQQGGLVLVDLADPPGRDQMPIRATMPSPAPVVDVVVSADASHALARTADDRVFRVDLNSLRMAEISTGLVADLPWRPTPTAARAGLVPPPTLAAETETPIVRATTVAESVPEPQVLEQTEIDASTEPAAAPPSEATTSSVPSDAWISGKLSGPAVDHVVAVVFLGPNNILREAARVAPSSDGRFELADLAPGRYRVQLDGGGSRVLLTEPAFRTITVDAEDPVASVDFRVLRER